jgi:hypothetical protein
MAVKTLILEVVVETDDSDIRFDKDELVRALEMEAESFTDSFVTVEVVDEQ